MAYLMRFSASFTTISTGIDASSERMVFTTLADGAGEKPNMVSADTASSITSLFTATAAYAYTIAWLLLLIQRLQRCRTAI